MMSSPIYLFILVITNSLEKSFSRFDAHLGKATTNWNGHDIKVTQGVYPTKTKLICKYGRIMPGSSVNLLIGYYNIFNSTSINHFN